METAVYKQLGGRGHRRKVEFAPQTAAGACKHSLGSRLISVQTFSQMQDPLQVCDGIAIAAVELEFLQGLAHHVFRKNGFLAMRFVLWRARLEIKTDGEFVGTLTFKGCELPQLFTRNHQDTPQLI